jgi:hypothetical protein
VRESERSLVAMFGGCVGRVRGVMVSTELRNGRFRDLKHSLIRLSRVRGGVYEEVSVWRTLS